MLFSQIIPPLPSPTESKGLFFTSVSLLLSYIQGHRYHLSKFHIYALVYCIGVYLSDLPGASVRNSTRGKGHEEGGSTYTKEYYSAIKKNTFESVLMRWMKLEPIIQSEVSQKEKHQYSILTHIYGI